MSDVKEIVSRLRARRKELGLSQARVAVAMGISHSGGQSSVHKWESGRGVPSSANLMAWAAALGLRVDLVDLEVTNDPV